MGMELLSHIAAGMLLGWVVDKWRGSDPLWLTVGAVVGLLVGMTEFIRTALKAMKQATRKAARNRGERPETNADESESTHQAEEAEDHGKPDKRTDGGE